MSGESIGGMELWLPENASYITAPEMLDPSTMWVTRSPALSFGSVSGSSPEAADPQEAEGSTFSEELNTSPATEFKLAGTADLQMTLASLLAGISTSSKPLSTSTDVDSTNAPTSDDDCSQPSTPAEEEASPKSTPAARWGLPQSKSAEEEEETRQVSVMVQNVPKKCARDQFAKTLNEAGFKGEYDMLYVLADLQQRNCGTGSALVSFCNEEACKRFTAAFHKKGANVVFPGIGGKKAIQVAPAPIQGCKANIRKLEKSTLLMSFLAERPGWQPALFGSDGEIQAEINGS